LFGFLAPVLWIAGITSLGDKCTRLEIFGGMAPVRTLRDRQSVNDQTCSGSFNFDLKTFHLRLTSNSPASTDRVMEVSGAMAQKNW
jgi:hypothetical protein